MDNTYMGNEEMKEVMAGETTEETTEEKVTYKDAFKQKEYMKLLIANSISRFGDSIDAIAFTWITYAITGSAMWSALIYAMNTLPSVLLQPFSGALVEGLNKKKVMVVTDFIRGIVVLSLALLYMADFLNPLVLVVFTLIISSVETLCMPAATAIIPNLIDMKCYSRCSSLSSVASTIMQLVGTAAAGVIIGTLGVGVAIALDALTFFLSGLILCFLKSKEDLQKLQEQMLKGYVTTLKEGFTYLADKPIIRNFIILTIIVNGILVPINALQAPLVSEVWKQGPEMLSVWSAAMVLSMGAASVVFPLLMDRMKVRTILVMSGMMLGVGVLSFALAGLVSSCTWAVYTIAIGGAVLASLGVVTASSVLSVQFMKLVNQEYLARAASIMGAGAMASTPVISLLVSGLTAVISTQMLVLLSGALCVIIFVLVGILKVRIE